MIFKQESLKILYKIYYRKGMKSVVVQELVDHLLTHGVEFKVVSDTVLSDAVSVAGKACSDRSMIIKVDPCSDAYSVKGVKGVAACLKEHPYVQSVAGSNFKRISDCLTVTLILIKEVKEPWFSWIVTGVKKYEGRLEKDDWSRLQVDQKILLYNENYDRQLVKVVSVQSFKTFNEAYEACGTQLIPTLAEGMTAEQCYAKIYRGIKLKKYNKVVVELELL